jgi:hypothetical protein
MYNTELPTRAQLPSSRQLLRSTLLAAAVAGVLLVTVVMPAEYGIDPTGVGRLTGLQEMGKIKMNLAREAQGADAPAALPQVSTFAGTPTSPASAATPPTSAPPATAQTTQAEPAPSARADKSDQVSFTLKPGESTEIKVGMSKDAKLQYSWAASGGRVNFDTHGDPLNAPAGFYHGYGKGRASAGEKGVIVAAFDGQHGWFWRNRSSLDAVMTLSIQGNYTQVERAK